MNLDANALCGVIFGLIAASQNRRGVSYGVPFFLCALNTLLAVVV